MKVLVLGSEGFIGNHVVTLFFNKGYNVLACDLHKNTGYQYPYIQVPADLSGLGAILTSFEPDIIINAAGKASVYESFRDPFTDFTANAATSYIILDAIRKYSPRTGFVFLSSAAVYGNPPQLPVSETDPANPISPYGFHKLQAELAAREFYHCFGINSVALRIFSCYGAGQRKLFLWDLCNKALKQKEVILKGCGNESRDFINVSDVAASIEHLVARGIKGFEIFNLASGNEHSIRDTALLLVNKLGFGNDIHFEGTKNTGNPDNWQADVNKLAQTGFSVSVKFEKGIEDYVQWFKTVSVNEG